MNEKPTRQARKTTSAKLMVALVCLMVLGCAANVWAAGWDRFRHQDGHRDWAVSLYQGAFTKKYFWKVFVESPALEDDYFTGVGVMKEVYHFWDDFAFEVEGQYALHYGNQDYHEFVMALLLRYHVPLGHDGWELSFALGEGVSYTSKVPSTDLWAAEESSNFLNYLAVELELGLPVVPVNMVLRCHHRSSIFGTFGNEGGSNFYTIGLRYDFE